MWDVLVQGNSSIRFFFVIVAFISSGILLCNVKIAGLDEWGRYISAALGSSKEICWFLAYNICISFKAEDYKKAILEVHYCALQQ